MKAGYHLGYMILPLLVLLLPVSGGSYPKPEGFIRHYTGWSFIEPKEWMAVTTGARLRLQSTRNAWNLTSEVEMHYNLTAGSFGYPSVRELKMEYQGDRFDVTMGKQFFVFGRTESDLTFNIFNPADLSEFLTQDISDLQQGFYAFKLSWFTSLGSISVIGNPYLQATFLPLGRWDLRPKVIEGLPASYSNKNSFRFDTFDLQGALVVNIRKSLAWDLDIAAGIWNIQQPSYFKTVAISSGFPSGISARPIWSKSPFITYSSEYRLNSVIAIQSDMIYWHRHYHDYQPELDLNGVAPGDLNEVINDFFRKNNRAGYLKTTPLISFMLGSWQTAYGWRFSEQIIWRKIMRYDDEMVQSSMFTTASFSATKSLFRENLILTLFSKYHINNYNYWFFPEVTFKPFDGVHLVVGLHRFNGKKSINNHGALLNFAEWETNSFIYNRITWYF